MEQAALEGATATLSRLKPVLYVENDRREKSESLIRCLDSLGYSMYWHAPPLFNPRNYFGNPRNVFGPIVSRNMLCINRSGAAPAGWRRSKRSGSGGRERSVTTARTGGGDPERPALIFSGRGFDSRHLQHSIY